VRKKKQIYIIDKGKILGHKEEDKKRRIEKYTCSKAPL
jgi:hypothetical protein